MARARTAEQILALLGRAGRAGGVVALAVAALFGWTAWSLFDQRLTEGDRSWFFVAPLTLTLAGAFGLTGLYLLVTGGGVFRADPRFAPMTDAVILERMASQPRPYFVCVDCRVVLAFEVSVGRCPRCNSASACLEVNTDADAATVRSALGL